MAASKPNSPLLGYNTNVRHAGKLFHIQTEDSGVGHPHVITHLFTEGTILATKKTSYGHLLEQDNLEKGVRSLMKEQHKAMFVELRDGVHDETSAQILGEQIGDAMPPPKGEVPKRVSEAPPADSSAPLVEIQADGVRVVRPAEMDGTLDQLGDADQEAQELAGRSIFDTPDEDGDFGDSLITDKSLDEVILSYLTEELDE